MSLFIYVAVMKAVLGDEGLLKREIELLLRGGKACRPRAWDRFLQKDRRAGRAICSLLNTSESVFCHKGPVKWLSR